MKLDLNKLKEVADEYEGQSLDVRDYLKEFSPSVVKQLIARIEELEKELKSINDNLDSSIEGIMSTAYDD